MGIIFPKKRNGLSKALIPALLIILSPVLIIWVLLYLLWGVILYLTIWSTHKKQFVVFVYSDSPTWKDYFEREFIPYLRDSAVILNWSKRKNWKNSLAVLAFRYFSGHRNFNPMGMIFRPFHFVKAYRFFDAFKEFKHGNPKNVEQLRRFFLDDLAA